VNPWITLFVIDLPAVLSLAIFCPELGKKRLLHIAHWLEPMPNIVTLGVVFVLGFSAVAVSSPVLILNEPKTVTNTYEVLEPETWIGKELPILEHIDIGGQLKTGNWLVVLYHHDCPSCAKVIPKIEKMANSLRSSDDFMHTALIEIPPYGHAQRGENTNCTLGKLDNSKEWFVTTPVSLFVRDLVVHQYFEEVPKFDKAINNSANKYAVINTDQ
jgi:hypothetical protein